MKQMISRFWRDEEGASAVEYALIAAVLAVILIVAVGVLGDGISLAFDNIVETLTTPG